MAKKFFRIEIKTGRESMELNRFGVVEAEDYFQAYGQALRFWDPGKILAVIDLKEYWDKVCCNARVAA